MPSLEYQPQRVSVRFPPKNDDRELTRARRARPVTAGHGRDKLRVYPQSTSQKSVKHDLVNIDRQVTLNRNATPAATGLGLPTFFSRGATTGDSLGRKSQEKRRKQLESRSDDMTSSVGMMASPCRRFAAHRADGTGNLGLTSQATTCHRFAVHRMWINLRP